MIALVAGATRGAGRGIAVALGEAGATVYCTGRSTREQRSEYDRPETIEETAELVTEAGGQGIAVAVDHLGAGARSPRWWRGSTPSRGASTCSSTTSGAARTCSSSDSPIWEHDLDNGLRMLRLALDTHLITSHHALPLLLRSPGGLRRRGHRRHRRVPRHPLPRVGLLRPLQERRDPDGLGAGEGARPARRHRGRAHAGLAALGDDARALRRARGQLARRGRADPALLHLRDAALRRPRRRGARERPGRRALERRSRSRAGQLAQVYGFTDLDGTRPDAWRYIMEHRDAGLAPDDTGYR